VKLIADAKIKLAYRSTKAQLTRRRRAGETGAAVDQLEARKEFLERLFAL